MLSAPEPVVIAGLPRCGTTLLATFLASQPRVSFLTDYLTSFTDATTRLRIDDWRRPLTPTQRRVALALVRDELLRFRHPVLVGVDDFASLRDLHESLLRELARSDDDVVGHKLLASDDQIRQLLVQTSNRIVVLYRDPRDAALSFFHRTGAAVESYVDRWRRVVRLITTSSHPRLFAVRYESMVSNPDQTLRPLFDALGLELSTEHVRLVFDRGAAGRIPWPGNSTVGPSARAFDARAIERWRGMPNSPIVRYTASTCRRELRALGYGEGPTLSIVEASRWRTHRAAHALARYVDRKWERGRARILELAAPSLRS